MFDALTGRLSSIIEKLQGRGALTEEDVKSALREVRIALLEADVALTRRKRLYFSCSGKSHWARGAAEH